MEAHEFYKKVGSQVRRFRKQRGMSQEKLAEVLDKSNDTISNIERGIYPPRMETVLKLANVLEISPYELFLVDELTAEDEEHLKAMDDIRFNLRDKPIEFVHFVNRQIQFLASFYNEISRSKEDR